MWILTLIEHLLVQHLLVEHLWKVLGVITHVCRTWLLLSFKVNKSLLNFDDILSVYRRAWELLRICAILILEEYNTIPAMFIVACRCIVIDLWVPWVLCAEQFLELPALCFQRGLVPLLLELVLPVVRLRLHVLVLCKLHVVAVQRLWEHHLVLLVLHLDLGLVVGELLEHFPLLLLGQVLREQQLSLLSEELHLGHLVQFLHLVKLLQLQKCLDLGIWLLLLILVRIALLWFLIILFLLLQKLF